MKVLALDLGTNCGVAHNLFGNLTVRTEKLATDREITAWGKSRMTRRQDPRAVRFHDFLAGLPTPDVVAFEDVEFQTYTKQTQLWSSYRTAVWLAFKRPTIIECVPVSTLKRFATGHGGATKEMMEAALRRQHPEVFRQKTALDDNGVDAAWIWFWANHVLARYVNKPFSVAATA